MSNNKKEDEVGDAAVYLGYVEVNDKIDSELLEDRADENKACSSEAVDKNQIPWLVNKIGGLPIYPYKSDSTYIKDLETVLSSMQCRHCKSPCILIFQITSPIDNSSHDRVLQIFTCVRSDCIKHSWFSMRCMFESSIVSLAEGGDVLNSSLLEVVTDNVHGKVIICRKKAFFKPFYLSVIEEPTGRENFAKNNLEALKLASKFIDPDAKPAPIEEKYKNLKNYKPPQQPAHLSDLDDFEKFQLEKLYNNDKTMYRFYKRVNRYPNQVVRYDWEGEPLLNSNKVKLDVQTCTSCSAKRKFELQLMSGLLNYLITDEEFDREAQDFSSIIMHSCSKNCSRKTFNLEDTYFMPDPDSRIFNKVKQKLLAIKLKDSDTEQTVDDAKLSIDSPIEEDKPKLSNASSTSKKRKKKKKKKN